MSARHQKVTIKIPRELDDDARAQLADDIIEYMRRRTEKGLDKNNDRFPSYSKAYINSLEFKIGGKSPSKVNLTLSGDMLAALTLLEDAPGKLVIGFEKGSTENARADGNIRGTYGNDSPIKGGKYARDFLGIAADDLEQILGVYE